MHLLVNDIIEYNNGSIYRIIWIDDMRKILYAIKVNDKKTLTVQLTYENIVLDLNDGIANKLKFDPYYVYRDEKELSKIEIEGRDKAWNAIKNIIDTKNYPDIFNARKRGKLIDEAIKETSLSKPTIYNYIRRYWIGGQTKNSLIPKYRNSGGVGVEKNLNGVKMGRPRINKEILGEGINITEEIKQIFKKVIKKYYHSKKGYNLTQVYIKMLEEYFSVETIGNNGKRILELKPLDQIPTFGQFKYWHYKKRNIKEEIIARKGLKEYEMNYRDISDNSMKGILGPGSLYQIDATIADIYLVSRYDRSKIIGRPTIYFVIDTYSRMITGVYVGYESPSWIGAMMALSNAASDKVKYCRDYEIYIERDEWDIEGIPEAIIGDRGELEGTSAESLINSLGIDIQNTPPYRPDWKGIVERRFNIIQSNFKSFTPGYVKKNFKTRGGEDYRLDAILDIYQFTQIIIKCILNHNNRCITGYDLDYKAIVDCIEPTPKDIWKWGLENKIGTLRFIPEDIIKLNLMPVDNARVTHEGIRFKNILYTCETAKNENWFVTAKNKGSWSIQVSYDPRNMNYIYIKNDKGRTFETCTIKNSHKKYFNKSLAEIDEIREAQKILEAKSEYNKLNSSINLFKDIDDLVDAAEKETNKFKNKNESKSKRIKNIRTNRKEEKEIMRKEESFILSTDNLLIDVDNDKDDEELYIDFESQEVDFLASLQEDYFND